MWAVAQRTRDCLDKAIPFGSIVAEHTPTSHHYRANIFPGAPLYDSVTTKTGIIDKGYLKVWGVKLAVEHIRKNIQGVIDEVTRDTVLYDASVQHEVVLDEAGGIGTIVHNAIEDYIKEWIAKGYPGVVANVPGQDVRVLSALKAFAAFVKDHYIIPVHAEMLVASEELQTGGTMDFICYLGRITQEGNKNCNHDFHSKKDEDELLQECVLCGETVQFELTIMDWKTSNSIKDKSEYAMQTVAYGQCIFELSGLEVKNYMVVRLDKSMGVYEKGLVDDPVRALEACKYAFKLYDYLNEPTEHLRIIQKEKVILNMI